MRTVLRNWAKPQTLALRIALCATCLLAPCASREQKAGAKPGSSDHVSIDSYIHQSWDNLTRSMTDCASLADPKLKTIPVLYLPLDFPEPPEVKALTSRCGVDVERLPVRIQHIGDPIRLPVEGLLYLPNKYVVPGGRFNEMYGWDSYFILLGLLQDHRIDLARGIVENFFFEIEHYGGILNANRTYYLTRSQPPFLTSMIRAVFDAESASGNSDTAWLARSYAYAVQDHALWMSASHRAGNTGLARYYDFGEGPVPEMSDADTYYPDVIRWLLAHPDAGKTYLVDGPANPTPADRARIAAVSCDPGISPVCAHAHVDTHWLSKDFYKGDRAMRESGFDTSFRFGPFSGSTHHYVPVCLNSLLYQYEQDLAWMAERLDRQSEVKRWKTLADARRRAIDKYLWNQSKGMYFDYDYTASRQRPQQSDYEYLTAFYPLWAAAATPAQAKLVEAHLSDFERTGGIAMSTRETGVQWDMPYGWAPVMWLTVDGLARYSDMKDAQRISEKFTSAVRANFFRDHTIREKYNVLNGSSEFHATAGYSQNVVGFGWTNGVYLKMETLLMHANQ
jgi:alpha,alpha-trehalase